jgi:anti-sigma B factor antagonist
MSHDEDFQVVTSIDSGHTLVTLRGDVDASIYATFQAAVHGALHATDDVTFDCAAVTFMDWSGLSVVVETLDLVTPNGGTVVIWRPGRTVLRLLQITGFDNLVTVADPQRHGFGVQRVCDRRRQRLARRFRPCSARSG